VLALIRLLVLFGLLLGSSGCEDELGPVPASSAVGPEDPLGEVASDPLGRHVSDRYPASLETILESRSLRVLTSRNAFDFFLHDGRRGGYQYEMARAFVDFLNERYSGERGEGALPIHFELIPVHDDQLIPLLLEGAADLIAARLTITPERAALVRFSEPYRTVDELLVTHDRTPPIESIEGLSGQRVVVRRSSSYAESLAELDRQLVAAGLDPIEIEFVDERLETERILELVAARRFPYTLADSMIAELAVQIHPQLRIVDLEPLRRGGRLAWATHPAAIALTEEMNAFLARYEEGSLLGNMAVRKYFEAESTLAARFAEGGGGISEYDPIFRANAERFGFDWRLAAAMAYQESRFDPTARNRWGAVGLLQIKPETAREPYVDVPEVEGIEHVNENVRAGLKYLSWIKQRYFDSAPEMRERDRLRMALAAYNAGPRTLIRARRRAEELGLDPNRWFRNVELALLDMRKTEPVVYVSEINQRYLAYLLLGVE
jgi:membrane-bound lytic murein transglycosylase MltF